MPTNKPFHPSHQHTAQETDVSTSLISSLVIHRAFGMTRAIDVPIKVTNNARHGGASIEVTAVREGYAVTLTLSGAERIALIEALGGKDAR